MKYEYEVVTLKLSAEQLQVVQMGLANIEEINGMICDLINEWAKDGWEPLYPFSVPQIWFRKPTTARRTAKKKTKSSKKTQKKS